MPEEWDFKASHSETEQFAACERRHYYSYGVGITGVKVSDPLAIGNSGHAGLGAYYSALQSGCTVDEAEDAMLIAARAELNAYETWTDRETLWQKIGMLLGFYVEQYEHEEMKIIEVEILDTYHITQEFAMPMKLDLIAEMDHYGVTLIDHKFCNDFYTVDKADLSPQLPRYLAVCEARGIHIDTIMYNQIRYRNTKDNLANPSERFERTPVPLTAAKVVRTMREQIQIAKRISHLKELDIVEWEGSVVRNSLHCQMCPFPQVCDSDLNGGQDSDLIVEAYYEPRKRPTK